MMRAKVWWPLALFFIFCFRLNAANNDGVNKAALDLYSQAVAAMPANGMGDASRAQELFKEAAQRFEASSDTDYRAWYDAGTARYCAGQAGLAALDLRRYLAHNYFRAEAWENLAQARKAAGTVAPGNEGVAAWPWALWFLAAAAISLSLAFLGGGLYVLIRRRPAFIAGAALGVAALCFGLASGVSYFSRQPLAVVIVETQGRKGDAAVYGPQPGNAWKQGQEAWITAERSGWLRLEIGGQISWVPKESVEIIGK
jgi:hypothetical protein